MIIINYFIIVINAYSIIIVIIIIFILFIFLFFAVALRPNAGHGLVICEVSRSHTTTHHSR